MTVQELYDWAKENNTLDYDIAIDIEIGDYGVIAPNSVKINRNYKQVVVTDH